MYIDKDSIQLKIGNSYVQIGDYIVDAKFGYHKLWTDAGRNLSGKMTATLIGIFPKITINFRKLTKSELEYLMPTLNSARQSIKYYDAEKQTIKTLTTYTNDVEITNKNFIDGSHKNDNFSVAFISIERRS